MAIAHVPKFGNWDDKDIAYTNYFDNVRKDKAVGFNPNDPEENPEAFILKQPFQEQHPIKDDNKLSQKPIVYPSTRSYNDSGATQMQAVLASSTEPTEVSNAELFSQSKKDHKGRISKRLCCCFPEPRE